MKNAACLVQKHLSEGMLVSGLANVPVNPCSLVVRARELPLPGRASQNERALWIICDFGANMLDSPLPFVSEKVEAQTVFHGIGFCNKTGSKDNLLC